MTVVEQCADLHHRQIYSLERYTRPTINSKQTAHTFVEISVDFINGRPTTVLELIFKDDAAVKHMSNNFKEGDLVHWSLNTFVSFAVLSFSETDRLSQLRYIDNPASVLQN
jgi:hypothetical protein